MPLRLTAAWKAERLASLLSFTSDDAIGSLVNSMFLNDAITRLPSIGLPVILSMPAVAVSASVGLVLM